MQFRVYRRPLPRKLSEPITEGEPIFMQEYEEIFVLWEEPLLEFTRDDVMWLKGLSINPLAG